MDYTPQSMVNLLHRIGFSYKKTREVPCECSEEKQVAFMEELSEILEDLDEETVVYDADGVHPTHNSRSAYAWTEKGEGFEQHDLKPYNIKRLNASRMEYKASCIQTIDDMHGLLINTNQHLKNQINKSDSYFSHRMKRVRQWI